MEEEIKLIENYIFNKQAGLYRAVLGQAPKERLEEIAQEITLLINIKHEIEKQEQF